MESWTSTTAGLYPNDHGYVAVSKPPTSHGLAAERQPPHSALHSISFNHQNPCEAGVMATAMRKQKLRISHVATASKLKGSQAQINP